MARAIKPFGLPNWLGILAFGASCLALPGASGALSWKPAHIVIVIEENHGFAQIIGNPRAPFLNRLAAAGALFTDSHGVVHPSQPNYLALFSGSTQGMTGDGPLPWTPRNSPNLGAALIAAADHNGTHYSFIGYAEGLPQAGSTDLSAGQYARKHNPWSDWQSDNLGPNQLLPAVNQPFANFPADFKALPTVAIVVPDLDNDEHGRGQTLDWELIRTSDEWLERNIGPYAKWAMENDSLLIVTWDENESWGGYSDPAANRIATILVGARVKPGRYDQRIDHYSVLRTIEDMYGLPYAGESAGAAPIAGAIP
jgi:hypothetical protein